MAQAESTFLDFVRLVIGGDAAEVSRRLAANPELARMVSDGGATRAGCRVLLLRGHPALPVCGRHGAAHGGGGVSTAGRRAADRATARTAAPATAAAPSRCTTPRTRTGRPSRRSARRSRTSRRRAPTRTRRTTPESLPLHRAVRTRSLAAVEALLDAGADPVRPNRAGSTPLHLAVQPTGRGGSGSELAREQQAGIIAILLARGAKPSDCDGKGKPVHEAATSPWVRTLVGGAAS